MNIFVVELINEWMNTLWPDYPIIFSFILLVSSFFKSLAVLPFCLKVSLPKFGNMVKDESNVWHCPLAVFGVDWLLWSKRRQGSWSLWCIQGLHAQAWPRPFSAKWEIKIHCSLSFSLCVVSYGFSSSFITMWTKSQRSAENIKEKWFEISKHLADIHYQAFNEIIINLFHWAHSSKCLNTLSRYHFVHPAWMKP